MDKIREILSNRWFKFGAVAAIYTLIFIIWSGSWLMLLGLPIIYDVYISKWYYRLFWGKYVELKATKPYVKSIGGWVEAIIFAVVVASVIRTYFVEMYVIPSPSMEKTLLVGDYLGVSKVAYGPKMANTPIAIPLVHNVNPINKKKRSYVEWIKRPYHRLCGLDTIKHNDVVVFNYPEGDTVLVASPQENYYWLVKQHGREAVLSFSDIMVHPVDKRDNYIKRAVGLPGNTLEVRNGDVYIDGVKSTFVIEGKQTPYAIRHTEKSMTAKKMASLGIEEGDILAIKPHITELLVTAEQLEKIKSSNGIIEAISLIKPEGFADEAIFPRDSDKFGWSEDNFGPLWIPRKGSTLKLTEDNLPLYKRAITAYEGNTLEVKAGDIFINGVKSDSYTFKMNYFFMMGDNRANSYDSRFFGFVPEDHIVGRASFIWFSKAPGGSIRFNRIFSGIK